jgi:hypothetical protein
MAHRFSWALFKLNNFSNFCLLTTFDSTNVAELFSLNSGVSHLYAACRINDVSRGSVSGPEIV